MNSDLSRVAVIQRLNNKMKHLCILLFRSLQSNKEKLPLLAAILAGGLASSCCIVPLLMVLLGLGSASGFVVMEPYRPILAAITLALIAWAAWRYWQRRKVCVAEGCPPNKPVLLWVLGGFSVLLLISPSLLPYI